MTLTELGEVNRGRSRHRPRYAEHLYGGFYPFVQTGDVKASGGRISEFSQTYSEAGLAQSRLWPAGTMCITIAANIAETGILEFPACFPDSIVGFTADPEKADVVFVEYVFRTLRATLQHQASGSVQDNINLETLSRLKFSIPELSEQQAIAEVLGAVDDKIAANTKLVRTSATLTQAIFTDAVRESDDGAVLSEITGLLSRGVTPKYSDVEETVVVLNQKCIRDQRVNLDPARRTLISKVREDKLLMMDDVLVNSTGQGTLGRVARWTHRDSVTVDSHITIVRFDQAKVDPVCAGMALLSLQETIVEMGEGSTGQTELSRTELGKLRMRLPKRSRQSELGRRFTSMSEMEQVHLRENQILADTRDMLLPQLMSGKLRVRDAERVLENAGV